MQIICTSLQTDYHACTSSHKLYRLDALPAAQATVSLKATSTWWQLSTRRQTERKWRIAYWMQQNVCFDYRLKQWADDYIISCYRETATMPIQTNNFTSDW